MVILKHSITENSAIYSYAKINLFLHVFDKANKGLHRINSIFCFLKDLYDVIVITPINEGLNIKFDSLEIDEYNNTVLKVIKNVEDLLSTKINLDINIKKNIPLGSGMGGGSVNAAAILKYLQHKYDIIYEDIKDVAIKVGSDVIGCFDTRAKFVSGTGDVLHNINLSSDNIYILVSYPNIISSSSEAYKNHNPSTLTDNIRLNDTFQFVNFINLKNDLQNNIVNTYKEIDELLNFMNCFDKAIFTRMTGSGSTCFAVFDSFYHANKGLQILKKSFPLYKSFISSVC